MSITMGVDPGDTCGITIGVGSTLMSAVEMEAYDALLFIRSELWGGSWKFVAIERFDLRISSPEATRTVETVGAVRFLVAMRNVRLVEVEASHKVKTVGLVPAEVKGHARDAEAVRLWALNYGGVE